MKRPAISIALGAAALALAAGFGSYRIGLERGKAVATPAPAVPTSAAEKKVLYWHDPMVPGRRFDKPGKSPFMDMQLVPVYAEEGEGGGGDREPAGVSVSARMRQNLGIRTAQVTTGSLATSLQVVGTVGFDERPVAQVQARSAGYVEEVLVRAPLARVRKGQPLLRMLAPDWAAPQEDYLAIRRMGDAALLEAARQRMRLAGMSDAQVRQVEGGGKPNLHITIVAPVSGVVTELNAREGMTLAPGAPLFRINGFDTVWVNAEVPEAAVARVAPGSAVEASVTALPGQVFKGKVGAILPEVNLASRTLKARIELANPKGELAPGMFASIRLTPSSRALSLLVPSEAVIRTGTRSVVVLATGDGNFAPVDVVTGLEANGMTEIVNGVAAGQKVVISGQFLLDSEASLRGVKARMGAGQ
jgi:Cu(I)/Ag(I) efflux system membrane fusion protein